MTQLIGRVTRCSTRGFVGALRLPEPNIPTFGAFCLAEAQQGQSQVVGLIYDLSVPDDEFARQIAASEAATAEQIADHQQNRQIPVEFSALAVGYRHNDEYRQSLPPQPPLPLAAINRMSSQAVLDFSERLDFLALIVNAPQLPGDELMSAALINAATVRPEDEQRRFLIEAGRQISQLLGHDIIRLDRVLAGLRPE